MDITKFVVSQRDAALLVGDYNSYRSKLARELRTLRKKLGRATPKNAKYTKKAPITAEDVCGDVRFVHLSLLTSERAWAHAMHMKSTQAEDATAKGITGSTRRHIISRLNKAAECAEELVTILIDGNVSSATDHDTLEARAYAYSLSAAEEFEKQTEGNTKTHAKEKRWMICLTEFSAARVIYGALLNDTKNDLFREVIANVVDPSIRYAAYQAQIPRTVSVSSVSIQYFPRNDPSFVDLIERLHPEALYKKAEIKAGGSAQDAMNVPNTIDWRGRTANIVDAAIGQALMAAGVAETRLKEALAHASRDQASKDKAAVYDDILIASQDAVDATRQALDELEREGVSEGDARIQDLRITSLAVNYSLIGWRIGRDRCLISEDDGITFQPSKPKSNKRIGSKKSEESTAKGLARLRERIALYDAILQSVDSIKELRGAVRDSTFVRELEVKRSYFQALKCLNIGLSHKLLTNDQNALALFVRARDLATSLAESSLVSYSIDGPVKFEIHSTNVKALFNRLSQLIAQYRGIVALQSVSTETTVPVQKRIVGKHLMVEQLNNYPEGSELLVSLVTYPPKLEPVPAKPLFLDVAWNYIDYPRQATNRLEATQAEEKIDIVAEEKKPVKKGWFGFGR